MDPRVETVARILVDYSVDVQPGQFVRIEGTPDGAPLILAVYRRVLQRGGNPWLRLTLDDAAEILFNPHVRLRLWRAPMRMDHLARNAGRTVSKTELSEQGLGRPLAKFDRSIDVHLSRIRDKLGLLADGRSCIQTVFRQGYQLIRD